MKRTALLAISMFATTSAQADPGHGMMGNLIHLLTEPDHLAILAVIAGAAYFTLRRLRARA